MKEQLQSRIEMAGQSILHTAHHLAEQRLIAGTWGNVSTRITDFPQFIAITPSGKPYTMLHTSDMSIINLLDGSVVQGPFAPSSELPLHLAIYRHRPETAAIVHTHSIYATACAVARRSIPPIVEDLIQIAGGEIRVADYALPGTVELAENAVAALSERQAVLLANHGVVACGTTLREAALTCELVERGAKMLSLATHLGGAVTLSDGDVQVMHQFYLQHYRTRQEEEG